MSDSTHEALHALLSKLRGARSTDEASHHLRAILDTHVVEIADGSPGSQTLEDGTTVFDAEDLLGVGAWLARRADLGLNAVPIEWLEISTTAAHLHAMAWLLPTLWTTWSPPDDHVGRLLDVLETVDPRDGQTRDALVRTLRALPAEGALAARIHALWKAERSPPRAPREPPKRRAPDAHRVPLSASKPDARIPAFAEALHAESPSARADAASALGDLLRGEVHPGDYASAVATLVRRAARETDAAALESMLYTLGEAADRVGSGALADWDPLLGMLDTVHDPECLAYVLTTLGNARHERYRQAIVPFLEHDHEAVREAAETAIAELNHVV